MRLDHENQKRSAEEWTERQEEEAAKRAAKASKVQMEEETARRRRERLARETEDKGWRGRRAAAEERPGKERKTRSDGNGRGRRGVSLVRDLPQLTADNLRAIGGNEGRKRDGDSDSDVKSELNRVIGDMNRTFLEGIAPAEEVDQVERRQREKIDIVERMG